MREGDRGWSVVMEMKEVGDKEGGRGEGGVWEKKRVQHSTITLPAANLLFHCVTESVSTRVS